MSSDMGLVLDLAIFCSVLLLILTKLDLLHIII